VLGDLATKATMTTQMLNSIDGITCNEVMGAMYAFPKITIPQKAIDHAKVTYVDSTIAFLHYFVHAPVSSLSSRHYYKYIYVIQDGIVYNMATYLKTNMFLAITFEITTFSFRLQNFRGHSRRRHIL